MQLCKMWNKDQHPENKEMPGASSLAAGHFFVLGADKTRSVYIESPREPEGCKASRVWGC